jgi:hypothetical protein
MEGTMLLVRATTATMKGIEKRTMLWTRMKDANEGNVVYCDCGGETS